jgi:hypothetical protein
MFCILYSSHSGQCFMSVIIYDLLINPSSYYLSWENSSFWLYLWTVLHLVSTWSGKIMAWDNIKEWREEWHSILTAPFKYGHFGLVGSSDSQILSTLPCVCSSLCNSFANCPFPKSFQSCSGNISVITSLMEQENYCNNYVHF